MYKLVVIADDFTGAVDTGAQFAKKGISTIVTLNYERDFYFYFGKAQVLVIDIESRHLHAKEAYQIVKKLAHKCIKNGVKYFYKKTDSALRGNIGGELSGLVDAFDQENLVFVPAYPKNNRVTKKGIHFINGKKVTETEFGSDPFEPVRKNKVSEIIAEQSNAPTVNVGIEEIDNINFSHQRNSIYILDAEKEEHLEKIAARFKNSNIHLFAGCAGFANYLPNIISLAPDLTNQFQLDSKSIVISGSINDITLQQIEFASRKGYDIITLTPEQKLAKNIETLPSTKVLLKNTKQKFLMKGKVIIDGAGDKDNIRLTNHYANNLGFPTDRIRECIAHNIGKLVKILAEEGVEGTYIIIGGDTFRAVIEHLGFDSLEPLAEIHSGIVLSRVIRTNENLYFISKSGGFGSKDILLKIDEFIDKISSSKE